MVKFEANNELAVQTRLNGWQQQTLRSQTQCISVLDIRHTAVSSEQDSLEIEATYFEQLHGYRAPEGNMWSS